MKSLISLFFIILLGASPSYVAAVSPNLIVIVADDMGTGHVSCLNPKSKIQTRNIDRLAKEGISFTDAHSASSICSPSRYSFLTGRYPWRTHQKVRALVPYAEPLIEPDRLTLPAFLKSQGYHSACIGKWHLGWNWSQKPNTKEPDFTKPVDGGPTSRGFDYYFGMDSPYHAPFCFIENNLIVDQPTGRQSKSRFNKPGAAAPNWKFEKVLPELTRRAISYIDDRAAKNQPFFLYFSLTSPHEPVVPSPEFQGKSGLNALADFILETDAVVGRILDTLETKKIAENTIVIFSADNGSSFEKGGKELQKKGHDPSGPYRDGKFSVYEGGHRVPFIAKWPGKIKPGSQSKETICLIDMLPTMAAILEQKLPPNAAPDGYNILPALLGHQSEKPIREATVHHGKGGSLAIRQGPWKLIAPYRKNKAELYNLSSDISESKNIASEHPDIVQSLTLLLKKYQTENRSAP